MSARLSNRLFAALFGLSALCALPAGAQDNAKPVTANALPLNQALTALSAANGFEVRGLDRVGDETVQARQAEAPIQALRHMLGGYAYTVELAPADKGTAAGTPAKLVRVSILGRAGDVAGDPAATTAQPSASAPVSVADGGAAPAAVDGSSQGAATHPVTHMLQSLALASMPRPADPALLSAAGLTAGQGASATGTTPAAGTSSDGTGGTPSNADMAALTRTASAGLSALVEGLKAACPAGAKC